MSIARSARIAAAKSGFRRLIVYLAIAGVGMVIASTLYLASYGLATPGVVVVVGIAEMLAVLLGGGLMAMGFYSSDSGLDETVAGAATTKKRRKR
ncbi:hypothetical protein KX816_06195 [Sphingosinicellaceae bacterium]|nr:hypothetical protein KX816_06195 [Sphingosinicellaceae bacterium]